MCIPLCACGLLCVRVKKISNVSNEMAMVRINRAYHCISVYYYAINRICVIVCMRFPYPGTFDKGNRMWYMASQAKFSTTGMKKCSMNVSFLLFCFPRVLDDVANYVCIYCPVWKTIVKGHASVKIYVKVHIDVCHPSCVVV